MPYITLKTDLIDSIIRINIHYRMGQLIYKTKLYVQEFFVTLEILDISFLTCLNHIDLMKYQNVLVTTFQEN